MKRLFLLFFVLIPVIASAQIQFGYLSYQQVLKEMPEYAQAMQELQTLKAKYDEEAARGEAEFQKKFVDFLQGQKDFPQSIMQKRQVQGLIAQAEKDLVAEVQKKLNRVLLEVGVEYGYGYILNTDDNACPYINPVVGVDVTELVRQKLGLTAPSQDDQNE